MNGGVTNLEDRFEVLLVQLQGTLSVRPVEGDQSRNRRQLRQVVLHGSLVVQRQRRLDRVLVGQQVETLTCQGMLEEKLYSGSDRDRHPLRVPGSLAGIQLMHKARVVRRAVPQHVRQLVVCDVMRTGWPTLSHGITVVRRPPASGDYRDARWGVVSGESDAR